VTIVAIVVVEAGKDHRSGRGIEDQLAGLVPVAPIGVEFRPR
jgi:hypothetical protein